MNVCVTHRHHLRRPRVAASIAIVASLPLLAGVGCQSVPRGPVALSPERMPAIATVDERYQSYNVEMLEVTGGKFWRPYGPELDQLLRKPQASVGSAEDTPAGMNPALYEYRPPIDLTNPRLRTLAAALGPAYVRVSGTWANTTYFAPDSNEPSSAPDGFKGVLTHRQWKGVVDFSRSVNAAIVTSFATSTGVRDTRGVWTPDQALRFLEFTRSVGGRIAAAEFMNEPTFAAMGGAPAGYDAAAYGRDFKVFVQFARQHAGDMLILGPGSVGETTGDWGVGYGAIPMIATRALLAASGPGVDAFSYHHYGASSKRCAPMSQTTAEAALSEEWLARTDETHAFYRKLRNEFEPGKPFWLTETADAACGGNPWASTFLDTFRYLDQLGRLAKQNVQVVAHNTLVASDYGLLDENTLAPRPNYWAALLWRRLMGTTVLESGVPIQRGLHVYAHCLRGKRGGVALLVINNDTAASRALTLPVASTRYTMASAERRLRTRQVQLNGEALRLISDNLPHIEGAATAAGRLVIAAETITFVEMPDAGNSACR